ncbi:LEF-9 [Urbanus proteus nucleopolyhedrovirus]|uniref:LEF-9 n=1 Tax=Urbanus proteus nucleopolyhedrovirus TaxID=1675866 RepID=A0A162GTW9_9ABAC|nr:LEF-9 [Urbanus proteus nucleopolyhedrovirus]AKR17300.1 LEF-9 [Urbanus proteus nucleopolyhedrovirus]
MFGQVHNVDYEFAQKQPITYKLLKNVADLSDSVFIDIETFKKFLKHFIENLKKIKLNFYNSLIEQLISLYTEYNVRNKHTDILTKIVSATTIVITNLPSNVFLKKLKTNKFTDNIDYLILPNFILWDHNFVIFLNKAFNCKHENGLVDIANAIQKIKLTHGIIKDQLQSKNGYAGQYMYSTFLNTASFYANVQCFNGANEIIAPKASLKRYYGRDVENARAWTTRHPNISQLSTQISDVKATQSYTDWNVKVGLGIFTGANTDCDGDKKVKTYMPKPNSFIDLECLLYGDPRFNFICFDKNRLSFVSQQIFYLYKKQDQMLKIFDAMPVVKSLWNSYHTDTLFSQKLDMLLRDCTLLLSSQFSYFLFKKLSSIIENEEMVCGDEELQNLTGLFGQMIECGSKGTQNLIESTNHLKSTKINEVDTIAERAINSLNNYINSHNRVKVGGGDIYHNTTVLQNVYLHNNFICYKNNSRQLMNVCALPSEFLFPEYLLDKFLD